MLNDYVPLLIIFIVAILVALIAVGLGYLFGPRKPTRKKSQPYESGMVPYGPGTRRISVRYYLIGVLFILFDIEVIFILPWAVVFRDLGSTGLWLVVAFALVLEVAYVYAWKKGALEWE
ncbi:MAG: NAD(P)H-quinone oxidoreductase subunit 3 [Chloroflexi bacterium]|jgi:NADH-quinone oxidoreductase subunit A|nr:NADH-quinone oxidoreductase subunit A [Anaerolineaceae bacterium]NMB91102.1 NAD(P)H-quinone oxidoreductase subunit 3 [Chloroflexota bacterium]